MFAIWLYLLRLNSWSRPFLKQWYLYLQNYHFHIYKSSCREIFPHWYFSFWWSLFLACYVCNHCPSMTVLFEVTSRISLCLSPVVQSWTLAGYHHPQCRYYYAPHCYTLLEVSHPQIRDSCISCLLLLRLHGSGRCSIYVPGAVFREARFYHGVVGGDVADSWLCGRATSQHTGYRGFQTVRPPNTPRELCSSCLF